MKAIRDTIVAGKTMLRILKSTSGNHKGKRASSQNRTSDNVRKNNERISTLNLWMLLNANFYSDSCHYTLTYNGIAPSQEQAAKDIKKFIRELRAKFRDEGKELKYVQVTEYLNHRIHHHIVINTIDLATVNETWNKGFVKSTLLDSTGNYRELAEYLIKETNKTFCDPESQHHRRYSASRNLTRPVIKREYVSASELNDDAEPIKGYYIPKDQDRFYAHPVTGIMHHEYCMVAMGDPRKYKIWRGGKVVSAREYYRADFIEEQQYFDMAWEV